MKTDRGQYYPRIQADFEMTGTTPFYEVAIERILKHVVPREVFEEDEFVQFAEKLPVMCWTPILEPPFDISFFVLCRFRANAYRFFYEMVNRWLIPGKRLNALIQFAIDFSMPEISPQKYIGGEVMVRIENHKELEILRKNLPIIESEIRLGMESYYQSCRILEIKGLCSDEKTALIQENIVSLIKHRPQDFDYDILSEMQHFLVLCKEEFKQMRSFKHMSRIICIHYLFRKTLKISLSIYPDRRYINIKLIRAMTDNRRVLGLAIGMSFLRENERFEARHILNGVQSLLPGTKMVEGSFFCNQSRSDPTLTIYLEIEKENLETISLEEERILKADLGFELKNRIEQSINPIFMPQNEEVIMRHIVALSGQIKYVKDLPQIIIDFAKQTEDQLEFLVVAVRVAKSKLTSISAAFEHMPTFLEFVPDRTKIVGPLKKYKKEASVFYLRIQKDSFLRKDHSVDLVKARNEVSKELQRVIGDFRDYNGGTISKENELFDKLRAVHADNAFLLESFFYSLNPPIMRSLLTADPLIYLFDMVLNADAMELAEELPYQISMRYEKDFFYIVVSARDLNFPEHIMPHLSQFSGRIVTCFIQQTELPCFGLIFRDPEEEEALRLRLSIEQTLAESYAKHLKY